MFYNGLKCGGGSVDLPSLTQGTATASDISSGKTAWVNGSKIMGAMVTVTDNNPVLNCGGTYNIPAGLHSGNEVVTANSLASQTDATAGSADIVNGKTAWVNGEKIVGELINKNYVINHPFKANNEFDYDIDIASYETKVIQMVMREPKTQKPLSFIPDRLILFSDVIASNTTYNGTEQLFFIDSKNGFALFHQDISIKIKSNSIFEIKFFNMSDLTTHINIVSVNFIALKE